MVKYRTVKERCNIHTASKECISNGCFMRRKWWPFGKVLFMKEDYKITEWGNSYRGRDYQSVSPSTRTYPYFWYIIGAAKSFVPSPDDILSTDWEVVQAISMTDGDKERMKGKIGGISFAAKI